MIFESSLLETRRRRTRVCATIASAAGQTAIGGMLILFSLAHTELIAVPRLATVIGAPAPRNMAVRQRAANVTPAASNRVFRLPVLTYPSARAEYSTAAFEDAPDIGSGPWTGAERAGFSIGDIAGILPPKPHQPEPEKATAPSQKSAPAAPARISISTGVQAAKLIHQVHPVYPALAKQARIQGTVRLTAVIATDGRIQSLHAESGHPLLIPAAVDAVRQWRYQPTLLNEKPVEVITLIQVIFKLNQ
jgi:protein TonB